MIRAALIAFFLAAPAADAGVAEEAAAAAADLQAAVAALETATEAQDRIAALTQTIRAYESGLAALRAALRQAEGRERELALRLDTRRDRLTRLLGTLSALDPQGSPMLLHPDGALSAVRAGMLMADVTPALQAEVDLVTADLTELDQLRGLQTAAGQTLQKGLEMATSARTALSQAMSQRSDLPRRFTEDPAVLRGLLESADTLEAFAGGLHLDSAQDIGFAQAQGSLALPALGRVILSPNETDARGVARPGLTLATGPAAMVTAPFGGTIRYAGPLLDYGNVIILEPGDGYLLVLAGMNALFGEVGQIVPQGAPLGLMGGAELADAANASGAGRTETLYLELRQGTGPVDPRDWFALTGE